MAGRRSTKPGDPDRAGRRSTSALAVTLDLIRIRWQGRAAIEARRRKRTEALIAHARANSPFYQRHYADIPNQQLDSLPPVTKRQLMASFDEWVCDPRVTLAGVQQFVAGSAPAGTPFLGDYFVCSTSGTTGHPGLFVHDRGACRVYEALSLPMDVAWLTGRQWLQLLGRQARWAVVVGTGGHFAGEGWVAYLSRRHWWRRRTWRAFSLQRPLPELVAELNGFQPAILTSYPSAMELLAAEQSAGRLRLHPVIVELGGESFDSPGRSRIAAAFGENVVHNAYGASEFLLIAFDCADGWLHVNADWLVLEPVEADYTPTPPGRRSHTVLLTNLANRVQPIIRYDLGDSVTERPDPCPCGNPLPAIRVEGRRDDVLRLRAPGGATVDILPLAVGSVIDETPGVYRSQLIQSGPGSLTLRLESRPGSQPDQVWNQVCTALAQYLAEQGLPDVEIVRDTLPPQHNIASGKFRQVIARPAATL